MRFMPFQSFHLPHAGTLLVERLQLTTDVPTAVERQSGVEEGFAGRRSSLLKTSGRSDNCTRQVVVPAGPGQGLMVVRVLDELDLGKLMLLIHQVRL